MPPDPHAPTPEETEAPPAVTVTAAPADRSAWRTPWVQLKYFSYHPCIYPAMIRGTSPDAGSGDLVHVYDKNGQPFGTGLYNRKARVPLRVIHHGHEPIDESHFFALLERAVDWRERDLALPAQTEAYRVVHSDGDSLSGLVVDRYGDVLSVEVHSLGVFRRLPTWMPYLHQRLGTRHTVLSVDPGVARLEGIVPARYPTEAPEKARIREHGIRFEVDFRRGHKTGFFCDQRDNRRRFATLVRGRRVLDLCCYTGGFALAGQVLGHAGETTAVDLDEEALAQARRNGNLNQVRVEWVHCDAFAYARQMQRNGRTWDAVVVDPPKLILSRDEEEEGRRKYQDLNQLAIGLVEPGGLLVSCSCSGLLSSADFEGLLIRAAHRAGRRLQFFDQTGAAPDHPVLSNCPESRYLKVLWARVWPGPSPRPPAERPSTTPSSEPATSQPREARRTAHGNPRAHP